jgi:hypothetical protein
MKKQIWLEPHQLDLVIDCLQFCRNKLCEERSLSDLHKMAGKYMIKRIDEVAALFEAKKDDRPKNNQ